MAPSTVQQRFGLKPEELNALTILSGLEGFRGQGSMDPAAVAASTLQRRLSGKWGGRDIRNIATSPGQFAAILDRGINMQQLGDPAFGAKILGGQSEFERLRNMVNDPTLVGQQMGKVGESFRALSQGPKPSDYIPVPGKSNFYFNQNPAIAKRGLQLLNEPQPAVAQAAPTAPPAVQPSVLDIIGSAMETPKTLAQQLLEKTKESILNTLFVPRGPGMPSIPPPIFGQL